MSNRLLDCNVELLALTRGKSSTLQPYKRVLVYQVVESIFTYFAYISLELLTI